MMAALTLKEGLYQEEKITARILGGSHLILEKEAKNYNSLCGGGSKIATQAMPPSPQLAESSPKSAELLFLTT